MALAGSKNIRTSPLEATLPGPSRTITVEPIKAPREEPEPVELPDEEPGPAEAPPEPDREPDKVPA